MDDSILYDSLGFDYEMDVVNTDVNSPLIYVAGDMLNEGARMRRAWEADKLRSIGATLHVPHEDKSINDKANAIQERLAERIVNNDTKGLMKSDVIVIDAHENGKGTLVELGQIKGMRDMANIIGSIFDEYDDALEDDSISFRLGELIGDVERVIKTVLDKKVYAHNTDIRRANTQPQSGDRREYGPNQYVYGTVLDVTEGKGFFEWDEIIEEVKELCE